VKLFIIIMYSFLVYMAVSQNDSHFGGFHIVW